MLPLAVSPHGSFLAITVIPSAPFEVSTSQFVSHIRKTIANVPESLSSFQQVARFRQLRLSYGCHEVLAAT
jgi:hypothetical protein